MLKNKTDLFTQHVVWGRKRKIFFCVVEKGTLVLVLLLSPNLCAFISAHLSTDTVSAPQKVWVLIRPWKQHGVNAHT